MFQIMLLFLSLWTRFHWNKDVHCQKKFTGPLVIYYFDWTLIVIYIPLIHCCRTIVWSSKIFSKKWGHLRIKKKKRNCSVQFFIFLFYFLRSATCPPTFVQILNLSPVPIVFLSYSVAIIIITIIIIKNNINNNNNNN